MNTISDTKTNQDDWRALYPIGGAACVAMIALIPIQIAIFFIAPPPDTVADFYALFQQSWLLGLLSLDLLYILNNTLLAVIYLALYRALRPGNQALMTIALTLGLLGIAAYYASNTAFEMLSLSSQFAAAATEAHRTVLLAAGEAMLAIYKGTAFDIYYVLNGIALLIMAAVMLRSPVFGRAAAYAGLVAAVLMTIPSTAGTIGVFFSLASLAPWVVFTLLIAIRFFRLGQGDAAGPGARRL